MRVDIEHKYSFMIFLKILLFTSKQTIILHV